MAGKRKNMITSWNEPLITPWWCMSSAHMNHRWNVCDSFGSMFLSSTHLEQGVEEYLCEWLRHSEVAVTGADLKGGLQTLYRNCSDERSDICTDLNKQTIGLFTVRMWNLNCPVHLCMAETSHHRDLNYSCLFSLHQDGELRIYTQFLSELDRKRAACLIFVKAFFQNVSAPCCWPTFKALLLIRIQSAAMCLIS